MISKPDIDCHKEIAGTYGGETQQWKEAQSKYAQLIEALERPIGISIDFEGLRNTLKEWGGR